MTSSGTKTAVVEHLKRLLRAKPVTLEVDRTETRFHEESNVWLRGSRKTILGELQLEIDDALPDDFLRYTQEFQFKIPTRSLREMSISFHQQACDRIDDFLAGRRVGQFKVLTRLDYVGRDPERLAAKIRLHTCSKKQPLMDFELPLGVVVILTRGTLSSDIYCGNAAGKGVALHKLLTPTEVQSLQQIADAYNRQSKAQPIDFCQFLGGA